MTSLASIMQGFFTDTLTRRRASAHTVAAYRDTFRLLLHHAQAKLGRAPSTLEMTDIDAAFVASFLDHLEADRGNSVTTGNARLAAIHSLFRYAALRCPEHALLIHRVLAIPPPGTPPPTCATSPGSRPTRCLPPPTAPARSAGVTI
jgi:integrase/recombinase XerD